MIVGVLKEIKNNENRVGLTPAGAYALVHAGHKVLVEETAGVGSGFADSEYAAAGAEIVKDRKAIAAKSEMIIKVKEPLKSEYELFRDGQIWFTYFHLAPEPELTEALMKKNIVAVAYETVQLPDRSLPLLQPMSEVAGRMSIQVGAYYLQKFVGGEGILIGGVAGVPAGEVVIVGGGIVGTNAAKMAIGLGAHVTILDTNLNRLRYLDDIFGARISTMASNPFNLAEAAKKADILVGSVLIPGARAPKLITEAMVKSMKPGSVIVDVAIDQGGSVETIDHATTHADPVFVKHGVVHYSVANMPGAVPRTSTFALTNATLPYTLAIANKGWKKAVEDDKALALGVNVVNGKVTFKGVAEGLNLPYTSLCDAIK